MERATEVRKHTIWYNRFNDEAVVVQDLEFDPIFDKTIVYSKPKPGLYRLPLNVFLSHYVSNPDAKC